MFTAYEAVHYSLFETYQEYALLTPGTPEAEKVAQALRTHHDETLVAFNTALQIATTSSMYNIAQEYQIYVVRGSNGTTFDIYMKDEDQRFLGAVTDTPEEKVLTVSYNLISKWKELQEAS